MSDEPPLERVRRRLQAIVQTRLDRWQEEGTVAQHARWIVTATAEGDDGGAEAEAEAATAAAASVRMVWPAAQVQLLPRLHLHQQHGHAQSGRRGGGPTASQSHSSGIGTADLSCRSLLPLVHAFRKQLDAEAQQRRQRQRDDATTAPGAGDEDRPAGAPAAIAVAPRRLDVDATMAALGRLLRGQIASAISQPNQSQQDDTDTDMDTARSTATAACAGPLSADSCLSTIRVESVGAYVNFHLTDEHRAALLAECATPTAAAAAAPAPASSSSSAPAVAVAAAAAAAVSSSSLVSSASVTCTSIGTWSSVFKEKHGTPRQGAVVPQARGRLTLHPWIPAVALEGLAEFSHVWLLFVFHDNGAAHSGAAKIRPPRLGGRRVGLFATRTPHRPNPLGLSLARLERVDGRTLHLSGVDLIDNTPLLDVKPYHPADCAPDAKMPAWMGAMPERALRVQWTARALQQLSSAVTSGALDFYSSGETAVVRALIDRLLEQDPRTLHSKERHARGVYAVALDRLDVAFRIDTPRQSLGTPPPVVTADAQASGPTPMDGPAAATASSGASAQSVCASAAPSSCSIGPCPSSESSLCSAVVFEVLVHRGSATRPRLRTKEWHEAITAGTRGHEDPPAEESGDHDQ